LEFEFDEAKSHANLAKHGIDFVDAQSLWLDPLRLEIPARTEDEPRWVVVGSIGSKHWSVIMTTRDEKIRIISARRSRQEEVQLYESQEA
jgi:uncharacterized DUF497 family protein